MKELLSQSGPVGYVLLFVAILTTALILYKMYFFRNIWQKKENTAIPTLMEKLKISLLNRNIKEFRKDEILSLIDSELNEEKRLLHRYLGALATISSVSPLLGLLGTITGMINSTRGILNVDNNMLLKGISEALITTAMGLVIAIPAILVYNYFIAKTGRIIDDLKEKTFHKMVL